MEENKISKEYEEVEKKICPMCGTIWSDLFAKKCSCGFKFKVDITKREQRAYEKGFKNGLCIQEDGTLYNALIEIFWEQILEKIKKYRGMSFDDLRKRTFCDNIVKYKKPYIGSTNDGKEGDGKEIENKKIENKEIKGEDNSEYTSVCNKCGMEYVNLYDRCILCGGTISEKIKTMKDKDEELK